MEQNSQMVLLLLSKLHFQVKEITDIHHIVAPSLKWKRKQVHVERCQREGPWYVGVYQCCSPHYVLDEEAS